MSTPATPTEGTREESFHDRLTTAFYLDYKAGAPVDSIDRSKLRPETLAAMDEARARFLAESAPLATDADAGGETLRCGFTILGHRCSRSPHADSDHLFANEADRGEPSVAPPRAPDAGPWACDDCEATNAASSTACRRCGWGGDPSVATTRAPSPATTGEGLDLGVKETWLTVEQETNRNLVHSLQILTSFTGDMAGKQYHAKRVRDLFASLLARVAQAEQDAARLDWMIANQVTLRLQRDHGWYYAVIVNGNHVAAADHPSLRAAIDAARATPTTETDR